MISNIVYALIICILIFVFFIALKAMKRGIQAKQKINKKNNDVRYKNQDISKKKNKT